ncbi:MAG: 30S ribosomal protein S8 [Acidimicrobiia bacterium]|nr:30S ribosomal protein S8 [Acidimicrobiia bacterium]MYA39871.1 30S ribosomal protein S8 [Acidimicrobiia bacterium]MYH05605.1 30S ribosomal protein S8 [Acidimicrobiia bacterium]MYJ16282.1 30S ribosomal protein S8 [Acidimicrobiia bacterium]MYK56518.1 30S ribosomal protein S8 [Acidimicrobiia bacterium]
MMTDPVADLLTRIRNGVSVRHPHVEMPSSRLKERIARILSVEGFVDGFSVAAVDDSKPHRMLKIELRYTEDKVSAISGLRRISKPGHRRYSGASDIGRVQGGMGVAIVSTSQGLLTDREARRRRLGGEILCEVW